jgi:hypothetical protein
MDCRSCVLLIASLLSHNDTLFSQQQRVVDCITVVSQRHSFFPTSAIDVALKLA